MTLALLSDVTVRIIPTVGPEVALSKSAADDRIGGKSMVVNEIRIPWGQDHALAHDNPSTVTMTIRSRVPVAVPQLAGGLPVEGLAGAKVVITGKGVNGNTITWTCWVNKWTCTQSRGTAADRRRPYTIALDCIDVIGRAQAVKLAAEPWPYQDNVRQRIQTISDTMNHVVPLDYAPLDALSGIELADMPERDVDNASLLEVLERTVGALPVWIRGGSDWVRFRLTPGTAWVLYSDGTWTWGAGSDLTDALPVHPRALTDAPTVGVRADKLTRFSSEVRAYSIGVEGQRIHESLPDTPWSTSLLSRPSDSGTVARDILRWFGKVSLGLPVPDNLGQFFDDVAGGPSRRFKATAKAGYPRLGRVRFLPDEWLRTVSNEALGREALEWLIEPWSRSGMSIMITPCPPGVTQVQSIIGGELIYHPDPKRQRLYLDLAPVATRHHTELRFASMKEWKADLRIVPRDALSPRFCSLASNGGLYA
ncbi:hypothetical protein HJ590_12125 [Naumannella sp. ID2617S]|nr:hypothetical protein [Naumannella sp. ID2617S]